MATTKVTTDVIDMSGNAGGLTWVKGTTAQQPSGVIGEIREDTDTKRTQVYTNQVGTPPTTSTCDYPAGAGAQALYQFDTATLTTDTCGNYSAGTNNNVTQNTTVKKFGTSSAEFNGTTADIDLEAGLDSTTMSVSFWIYIDATITTNGVVVELENGYGVWFIASASGKLGVQNNNANNEATLSNAQLGTGAWHHVAAVWTGVGGSSNRTFYLDNVVQTGGTVSDYLTCNENTLGSRRSGEFFDGYLDQVRFYNTALTVSQVDNLFKESSTSTGNEWRNLKEEAVDNSFSVDYLIVAGGGSGGGGANGAGGGGGAGGYKTNFGGTALSLTPSTNYAVTVGPGAPASSLAAAGTQGTSSSIDGSDITAISTTGGGAGGYDSGAPSTVGGSGGGAAGKGGAGSAGTGSEGNGGGSGYNVSVQWTGGGGGGAGVGGDNAASSSPGNGGAGLQNNIDGLNNFYAGGGGGGSWNTGTSNGAGGSSIGGSGGKGQNPGTNGSLNTGSGGGGGGQDGTGGQGGSGVIILRYPATKSATLSGGATGSVDQTVGSDRYAKITASGTITFS